MLSSGGCHNLGGWMYNSIGSHMPDEGWKLHISGKGSNAQLILNVVGRVLSELGVVFKFLETTESIDRQTGVQKGKWLVIYPQNILNAFVCVYNIDQAILDSRISFSAPKIKGEKRVGRTIIYTRYGGFTNDFVLGPDNKRYVSKRGIFKPKWIKDPWGLLKDSGKANVVARLSTFQPWPKHPKSFRRG